VLAVGMAQAAMAVGATTEMRRRIPAKRTSVPIPAGAEGFVGPGVMAATTTMSRR
jgi:hypothetical protein